MGGWVQLETLDECGLPSVSPLSLIFRITSKVSRLRLTDRLIDHWIDS